MPDINTLYDTMLETELTKRLGRKPLPNELINADNDSDLVNEILWQLVVQLASLHTVNAANITSLQATVTPMQTQMVKANPAVSIPAVAITKQEL